MVSRAQGLLAPLNTPARLPAWLEEEDLAAFVRAFSTSGFQGGLNYYRNLDRNRELMEMFSGLKVQVPALFMVGERDAGLSMPGMRDIIAAMPALVPHLTRSAFIERAGHWLAQERPQEVNALLIDFLNQLAGNGTA
jgi:pimeloyl-ACP methyl ester carboxylesterase